MVGVGLNRKHWDKNGLKILNQTSTPCLQPQPVANGFPGSLTLFDWIAFSFDSNQNFNGNTTQVDQFGLALSLNGSPKGTIQGLLNTSRGDILNAFGANLAAPFGKGVLQVPVPKDDVCNQNPSISLSGTTGVNIQLGKI